MTELKRKVLKGFEDWTDRIKSEFTFKRPGGEEFVIPIQSLSDAERVDIINTQRELTPARPQLGLDRKNNIRNNKPNRDAETEYAVEKKRAEDIGKMLVIEKGTGWEIPGKNYDDKLDYIQTKVAGEVDDLYMAIMRISGLTDEDVDFF